jgi:hypothetical protein
MIPGTPTPPRRVGGGTHLSLGDGVGLRRVPHVTLAFAGVAVALPARGRVSLGLVPGIEATFALALRAARPLTGDRAGADAEPARDLEVHVPRRLRLAPDVKAALGAARRALLLRAHPS